MKKKLSLLIVAFMALAAYAGLNAWRAASDEVVYTFIPQKPSKGAITDYTKSGEQTIDGVTWDVPGNWYATGGLRLGGKNLDKVDRVITGKTAIDKAVGKLTFNHGGVTSDAITVNSVTVTVASDAEFNNVIETITKSDLGISKSTDGSFDFEPTSGEWPANSYYKFTFNITNTNAGTNYAFVLKSIVFYGVANGDEGQTEETKTVYLKPGVWNADGARFAAYLFKEGNVNTWVDFTSTPGGDGSIGTYFKADIPVSYTGMVLVRMNGETTENNWDNDWNQTDDIDISSLADNTLYRITGWGSGSNSPYDTTTWPEQSTDPDPQTEDDVYYAVGVDELWGWSKADANKLVKGDDGKYRITKENAMLPAGEYGYKIMKNDTYVPEGENNEKKLKIERSAYYNVTLTLDPTADPLVNGYEAVATIANRLNSIAEVQAADAGTDVAVEGVVYASAKDGAVLYDYQDYLFYYNPNNTLTVGQKVVLTGQVAKYGGASQLTKDAKIYNTGTVDGIVYPDPVTLTGTDFDAIKTAGVAERKYVTFTGKLTVNNYFNVAVPGAESAVASIVKPSDDVYKSDLNGKDVVVKGYMMYITNKYVYTVATSIEEYVAPVTINSMAIVGELTGGWPDTETGDWSMAKEMTKSADNPNIWTLTVAEFEAEAKEYKYKATANGKYGDYELPAEGDQKQTFTEAGKYSLLFTADTEKHELTLEATKVEESQPEAVYYAVGVEALWGKAWVIDESNKLTKGEDGMYSITKTGLTLDAGNYGYKVVKVVGETQTWIPDGTGDEKLLAIDGRAVYSVTLTLDATDPITVDSYQAVATKTGEAGAVEETYTVVGAFYYTKPGEEKATEVPIFGESWDPALTANDMTKGEDGIFYYKKADVELPAAGNIALKVAKNHSWDVSYPEGEGVNVELKTEAAGKYDIAVTFNPDKKEVKATATPQTTPEPPTEEAVYYAVGVEALWGKAWAIDESNKLTKGEDGMYSITKTGLTLDAGNYGYKVVKVVGETQTWIPDGTGDEKLLAIDGRAVYSVTLTLDATDPITVDSYQAVATKTGEAETTPATVTKVQICGATDAAWTNRIDFELNLADPNVYFNKLDATAFTDDVEFQLVINEKDWLGIGKFEKIEAPEGLIDQTTNAEGNKNLILKNSNGVYKTYGFKAHWKENPDAGAGWSLEVLGIDKRETTPEPTTPELIVLGNNVELFGAAWDTESTANTMELKDGKYYRTYTKVQPQETDIELKAYNKTNNTWYGNKKDGQNVRFNMKAEGDFTVVLDVNADFTAGNVEVTGDNVEMIYPEPEQPGDATWTVAGEPASLFGEAWNPALADNDMVKGEDGLYKWEKTEATLAAGSVEFKVVKNHAWGEAYPDKNYKLLIDENGKYTVTITFNEETKEVAATATKTGEAIIPDAEITSVQLPGDWNWALEKGEDGVEPKLVLTKGEDNTWTGVLDLTEVTTDQKFKLVVNKKEWLGLGELTLNAGELVSTETDKDNNFILLNATSGYQTYNVTATWEPSPNPKAGWTLTIAGKDERPVVTEPVYTLVGAFYDVESKESASFFGESWTILEANNLEKIYDGFYKKEYTGINLEKGNVSLKVLKDGDWDHPYPNADGYQLEIPSAGVYDLTFTFHPDQSVVRGEADKKSDPIEITRMDIVGDFTGGWPNTETGDWSVAKAMTQDATNPAIWTLTVEDFKAEAKTYEYKATANGQYGVYELPASGNNNWVFGTEAYPAGKYDLLFTANTADNSLTVVPTLTEVETVILDEEETLAENQVLEVDEPFTSDEITVEDGQIITIEADEAGESLVPRRAFRALAASDITIQYKPEAGDDWKDAPVTVETNETGYQFEVTGAVATAINDRGFAIKANKAIVVTQVAVVTEVTPDPEPEPVYYAVGVKALWGVNDWTVDEANKLTLNGEGKYTITKTELTLDANTNYGYKVVKKVGDTQYWIPDGMNNEKNLTVTERAVYSVTLTLDPAEPLTAESFNAVATKTGEAEPAADAEITKVEIRGDFNGWDSGEGLQMTKQGETNTYVATLDLTENTSDIQFKLVLNNMVDWLGWGELELVAPENWTEKANDGNNIVLKNASTGYKTYTLTATWTPGPVAKTGWKLEIAGKDERPAVPATITKVELRGEFTNWGDGEGVELTKQGETDTYAGVLDLSEITADQAFKLVINDKTYWIDFNHLSLVAPDGWLVKESGEVTEPAIILTNSSTGYKTYDITATWTPSPNAAAGWTLTVAGKDLRPVAEDTYTVFGAFYDGEGEHASILTKTWDPTATENDMVKGEGNVYTKTYADAELTAGTFQLKVAKNHNDATSYPEGYGVNYELPIAAAGKYDVVVTFNADTKEVTAVATPKDVPEANYYIVGSMTDWQTNEAYKLTLNEAAEAGIVEYKITLDLEANAEFKVAKSDDGIHVYDADWYPTGMDNNYKITKTSNYTVYFRPNGDGGDDWHYHYIYAQDNNPTGINGVKADALKDAEVYTINGQRVQNPTKGLYIVNGKKVVIK